MTDTDVNVSAGPTDWILAEAALCHVLAKRYSDLAAADVNSYEAEVIREGIRPLERVRMAILEAVYPEPEEEPEDGIDMARREREIVGALA